MSEGAAMGLGEEALRAFALRPFEVLEALGLSSQYERSFKLQPGELLTQRYMLMVRTDHAPREQLVAAARVLGMPAALCSEFSESLDGAVYAIYGFEGSDTGVTFKVYAEYRARARTLEPGTDRVALFRGYKWRADLEDPGLRTIYWWRPALPVPSIREHMARYLGGPGLDGVRDTIAAILGRAIDARPGFAPYFLELGESDRRLRAFDLNLYDADLRVANISAEIESLARAFDIDARLVERLLKVAGPGVLGHLSAGLARNGAGFVTLYFKPGDIE